jgi:hypothetical protein
MLRTLVRNTLIAAACVTGFSGSAVAASINSLSIVDSLCANTAAVSISSANTVEDIFDASFGQCDFGGTARAGNGAVGINLGLETTPGLGGHAIGDVEVITETLIEITISAPVGFAGGEIPVSFSAHLAGSTSASIVSSPNFARGGSASVTAFTSIAGSRIAAPDAFASATANAVASALSFGTPEVDGELLPEFLTPATIFVDPSQPIEVLFRLTAGVGHSAYNDSVISLDVLALDTLSFALSGPVLNLPPGFTANSEFGMIVDNVYVIPEPTTLTLATLGLLGMSYRRRKRA